MPNIITVTLNPALDLSTVAGQVVPGAKIRCDAPFADPGGGGVNVSRAIRNLGGRSLAVVCLGGTTGTRLRGLLDQEGITSVRFEIEGETRQSFSVIDAATNQQFRYVMPGPTWEDGDEQRLLALIAKFLRGKERIVLSGSVPAGVSADIVSALNDLGGSVGASTAVDISGAHLGHLVANPCQLWVLRMDKDEAEGLSGGSLPDPKAVADFAQELVEKGVAEHLVIGCGSEGSVLASKSDRVLASCAVENVRSRTGAGDSLLAAFVLALSEGASAQEAIKRGVAAAAAAMLTDGTDLCRAEDYNALLAAVTVKTI